MPKWLLEGRLYESRIRVVTDDGSRDLVALVDIGMSGSTENARLIAAAPALLEALEDLLDLGRAGFIQGQDIAVTRAVEQARAAIRAAKGEPKPCCCDYHRQGGPIGYECRAAKGETA